MKPILKAFVFLAMMSVPCIQVALAQPAQPVGDPMPASKDTSGSDNVRTTRSVEEQVEHARSVGEGRAAGFTGKLINFDFDGGSLEAFTSALQAVSKDFTTIVFRREGVKPNTPMIPAIHLRDVTANDVFDILDGFESDTVIEVEKLTSDIGTPIVRLTVAPLHRDRKDREFRVYALGKDGALDEAGKVIGHETLVKRAKEKMEMIELALEFAAPGDPAPQVKFHEPSMTLLFKGTPAQVDAIDQVLCAMEDPDGDGALGFGAFPQERAAQLLDRARMRLDATQRRLGSLNGRLVMPETAVAPEPAQPSQPSAQGAEPLIATPAVPAEPAKAPQ